MDATPEFRDVDFARTGAKLDSFSASVAADWRTLMVVGQGKGGRSFVAMDVTSLSSTLTEDAIAGKVLWEFTHADMGFSFGRPLIAKTRRWGWVVILTGGYNNTLGSKPGQGVIFVLNAKTGQMLTSAPVYTGFGSEASPSGLTQIEGYTPSYQDYTLEYVYGGDLYGNLWRFDFSSASADAPPVTKIAEFIVDGVGQPVTTAPKIEYSADDLKRYVFVGTGRLLAHEDQANAQQHTMYAVRDGTKSSAYGSATHQISLPAGVSFPVGRANMSKVTDLLAGATLDDSTPMGWYYDLSGKDSSGATERVVLSLQANDGVLTWVGSIMNDDPCNAAGSANVYSVQYGSGQSVLYTVAEGLRSQVKWQSLKSGLADIALVRIGSSIRILGTDVKGGSRIYGSTVSDAGEPRVVNWRVIRE
jgi:type IV pilus assembly protein PilY1